MKTVKIELLPITPQRQSPIERQKFIDASPRCSWEGCNRIALFRFPQAPEGYEGYGHILPKLPAGKERKGPPCACGAHLAVATKFVALWYVSDVPKAPNGCADVGEVPEHRIRNQISKYCICGAAFGLCLPEGHASRMKRLAELSEEVR